MSCLDHRDDDPIDTVSSEQPEWRDSRVLLGREPAVASSLTWPGGPQHGPHVRPPQRGNGLSEVTLTD